METAIAAQNPSLRVLAPVREWNLRTLDDKLNFALGGYYFYEAGHLHDYVIFPGGLLMIDGPNDLWTTAYALYGHLNYRLNDLISVKLPITAWRTAFDLCADRKALKVLMHP